MLWALADLFECTIDELVGRTVAPVERLGVYDDDKLRLMTVAKDLLRCSEISREYIASYIGMEYRERIGNKSINIELQCTRSEIIEKHKDKGLYSYATDLMEVFGDAGDFETQVILRNLDNDTLTKALCGAFGRVVTRFLSNLSDRMLYLVSEDMERWQGTEEEILAAQRKVLEVGSFCVAPWISCCTHKLYLDFILIN